MSSQIASEQIRESLTEIATGYAATLAPSRNLGDKITVRVRRDPPLLISADTLDVRAQTRAQLTAWTLYVIAGQDLHPAHLSIHDVGPMCELISRHADWLAASPRAGEAAGQLAKSARALTHIADPHRRTWMSLGPCPLTITVQGLEQPCTGTIRAYPAKDPRCDGCRVQAVVPWWEHKMFGDTELTNLLTAAELVEAIHREFGRTVKEVAIRQWVTRGLISPKGTDSQRRSLFDRVDVLCSLAIRAVIR